MWYSEKMDYLLMFVLGACTGSFLSVVVYRLRHGGSALKGRSRCDGCKKTIAWYDNIPLLSFLILNGKCRYCKKPISIEYPLTEVLIGLEFVWVYWLLKVNFSFFNWVEGGYSLLLLIYWLILFSGSIAISIYDIKHLLIPDQVLIPMIVVAFLRLFISNQWMVLLAAIGGALFFAFLWWLTKGKGMGFGDVKLGFLMGLVLGWQLLIVAIVLAFLTGAGVGVILILLNRKKLKSKIAFGPFLLASMLVAKLWGWSIWHWYVDGLLF